MWQTHHFRTTFGCSNARRYTTLQLPQRSWHSHYHSYNYDCHHSTSIASCTNTTTPTLRLCYTRLHHPTLYTTTITNIIQPQQPQRQLQPRHKNSNNNGNSNNYWYGCDYATNCHDTTRNDNDDDTKTTLEHGYHHHDYYQYHYHHYADNCKYQHAALHHNCKPQLRLQLPLPKHCTTSTTRPRTSSSWGWGN